VQHRVEPQQRLTLPGPVADAREASDKLAVVFNRTGTREEEAVTGSVGFPEGDSPEVVEPIKDLTPDPFVVRIVAGVVK
jgi:hypothetical protein